MNPVRNLSRNKGGKNINQGFVPRADRNLSQRLTSLWLAPQFLAENIKKLIIILLWGKKIL